MKRFRLKASLIAVLLLISSGAAQDVESETYSYPVFTVNLPAGANQSTSGGLPIPGADNVYPVAVSATADVKVSGVVGRDPAKRLKVELISPTGSTVWEWMGLLGPQETKHLDINPTSGKQYAPESRQCRNWQVRLTNPDDNATQTSAQASVRFQIHAPARRGQILEGLKLDKDATAEKTFVLTSPGSLVIIGFWVTDELVGLLNVNYKLTFIVKRPDGTEAGRATGFANNVINVIGPSNKLRLGFAVRASDVDTDGDWKIVVKGSSEGKVKDLRIRYALVPKCF